MSSTLIDAGSAAGAVSGPRTAAKSATSATQNEVRGVMGLFGPLFPPLFGLRGGRVPFGERETVFEGQLLPGLQRVVPGVFRLRLVHLRFAKGIRGKQAV